MSFRPARLTWEDRAEAEAEAGVREADEQAELSEARPTYLSRKFLRIRRKNGHGIILFYHKKAVFLKKKDFPAVKAKDVKALNWGEALKNTIDPIKRFEDATDDEETKDSEESEESEEEGGEEGGEEEEESDSWVL